MTVDPIHRDVVRAMVLGDDQRVEEIRPQMPEQKSAEYFSFVSAVFCVVVDVRFPEPAEIDDVVRFVEGMKYDFRAANPAIKPLVIETAIRGVLGEEHLVDDLDAAEMHSAQLQVLRKIVFDSAEIKTKIDALLSDAEDLAREWDDEEG